MTIAPSNTDGPRSNWSLDEIRALFQTPLLELIHSAQIIHRQSNNKRIQLASLLSIKTGGCSENCGYCAQSAHHAKNTGLKKEPLMSVGDVLAKAKQAKDAGASRFCMGAAWREVKDGEEFDQVLAMVEGVRQLGMEACVTLGMLKPHQAERLAKAGLSAYNHNLDTSPRYYEKIVSTHTYEDRLNTLQVVRDAGVTVCCGGIIGMGENPEDRMAFLHVLSTMNPHPESVPINALVPVRGTPLQNQESIDSLEFVRMIAVARILMPHSYVRLSAGRHRLNREAQALCFMAGANSIFYGEKLLTTSNNDARADRELLNTLGLETVENEIEISQEKLNKSGQSIDCANLGFSH